MEYRDMDKALAPGNEVLADSPPGTAERRAELPRPRVLGRIPDLDASDQYAPDLGTTEPSPPDDVKRVGIVRRLLDTRLRTKLLIGAGMVLAAVTVISLLPEKTAATRGGLPPAPDAPEAPAWNAQAAESSDPTEISPDYSYVPNMSFSADLPPAPDFIEASQIPEVPASLQAPAKGQDRSASANEPWRAPAAGQQSRAAADSPRAWANQPMTIDGASASSLAANDTLRHPWDSQANLPSRYPAASISYPMAEPGVARLEGIIEKPTIRTTYDSTRSSVY